MKTAETNSSRETTVRTDTAPESRSTVIRQAIKTSWSKIAPMWPLKNLIAVNPIAGFEELAFETALKEAKAYFQQQELPESMHSVNRLTIKWLQGFFDEGQATIRMPHRNFGFLPCTLSLLKYDEHLHGNVVDKRQWLDSIPMQSEMIIVEVLSRLGISRSDHTQFLTLMLTTLPGWAAYIQYQTSWADPEDTAGSGVITKNDYLAFRLVLTYLIWPDAKALLSWHQQSVKNACVRKTLDEMRVRETSYQNNLLRQMNSMVSSTPVSRPDAQLIFCIDVRSEPFRRAIEAEGRYETYGFAGFFGVPVKIKNAVTGNSYVSCPVLLKPSHTITEYPNCSYDVCTEGYDRLLKIKKLYQSLKYTIATPFNLVEAIGLFSGLWMALRSFLPRIASGLQAHFTRAMINDYDLIPQIDSIPLGDQVAYAQTALRVMGLTDHFSSLVIFCGHRSATENNAYATSLDCGACGGNHGAANARVLAAILNSDQVRRSLSEQGICIPDDTLFVAAQHNTTTDDMEIFSAGVDANKTKQIDALKVDLKKATIKNAQWRLAQLGKNTRNDSAHLEVARRAKDWAQVRPEWGLARNASFIVAPRFLTKEINLEGRAFLHSYDWEKDKDGTSLSTILTAPMIVAQWINAQYLFSTLDNVAYGGGSKMTKNITGKIGVMQGNASDLMHGLSLQSVYKSDAVTYHEPMRLSVIVYAPKRMIDSTIMQYAILRSLFGHRWVHLICIDPEEHQTFILHGGQTWKRQ